MACMVSIELNGFRGPNGLLLSCPRILGAPHLARFSRDVGFHCPILATVESRSNLEGEKLRSVVSHISRKTSEMWGTHVRLLIEANPSNEAWRQTELIVGTARLSQSQSLTSPYDPNGGSWNAQVLKNVPGTQGFSVAFCQGTKSGLCRPSELAKLALPSVTVYQVPEDKVSNPVTVQGLRGKRHLCGPTAKPGGTTRQFRSTKASSWS
jgi:hypothetical protein